MAQEPGFDNRRPFILSKIRSLLTSLPQGPPEYDKVAPDIEFWIEYVLRERFMTVDELVGGVSRMAWDSFNYASVARFLKEFRDAPHRSEQARSFVDKLCEHVIRWFAIASVEDPIEYNVYRTDKVAIHGGDGFVCAASFVGHLIESGMLDHELVRRHLVKPLTAHHHGGQGDNNFFRVRAIYQLFIAAGNTLLRGLLEPEDVEGCFKTLNIWMDSIGKQLGAPITEKLKVRCVTHSFTPASNLFVQELREINTAWLEQKENEEQRDVLESEERRGEKEEDVVAAEVPAEVETPIAFVPQDLPAPIDVDIPSSIWHNVESSSETFVNILPTAVSSPTLTISTISDLTPTELGEEVEHAEEQKTTRHDTFYFEDGNVEIVCEHTVFRVHSTIISFSSSKLRDILSPSTILSAPMPEGCPRIAFIDSAEDFGVLLKMIYTPGYVPSSRYGF